MPVPHIPAPTTHATAPSITTLMDGSELETVTDPPGTPAGVRALARTAQFYFLFGSLHRLGAPVRNGQLAGYGGISSLLNGSRPAASLAFQCTRGSTVLRLHTMALLRRPWRPYTNLDAMLFVEAHSVRGLIGRGIAMTNRVTSCELAAARLSARQRSYGLALADQLADALHHSVFAGQRNDWPFPLWQQREISVAVVQRATRALDAWEIVHAARAAGARLSGGHSDYVIRRDLLVREPASGAPSRVASGWHQRRFRRIWWPHHLSAADAAAGYDRAHP